MFFLFFFTLNNGVAILAHSFSISTNHLGSLSWGRSVRWCMYVPFCLEAIAEPIDWSFFFNFLRLDKLDNQSHKDDKYQRRRRRRNLFTESQVDILKSVFAKQRYLSAEGRKKLAESLNLSPKQVKTWFQNYRYKCRRKTFDDGYSQAEDHEMANRLRTSPLTTPTRMNIPHSEGSSVFFRNPYYSMEHNASVSPLNTFYDRYYSMVNFPYPVPSKYQHIPTCPQMYTN